MLILDALLKYAAHKTWPLWLFRPQTLFDAHVVEGALYPITLLFPGCKELALGHNVLADIAAWLARGTGHFVVAETFAPRIWQWSDWVGDAHNQALIQRAIEQKAIALEVMSPLPCTQAWFSSMSALWLGEQLLRRYERLFGAILCPRKDLLLPWLRVHCIPEWMDYVRYNHRSRSQAGSRLVKGVVGTLFVEGDIAPILPLLLFGSRFNVGSRLSVAQGAFRLVLEDARLDRSIGDEARQKSAGEILFHTCVRALTKSHRLLASQWREAYPSIVNDPSFFDALSACIPKANTRCHALVETLHKAHRVPEHRTLWEPGSVGGCSGLREGNIVCALSPRTRISCDRDALLVWDSQGMRRIPGSTVRGLLLHAKATLLDSSVALCFRYGIPIFWMNQEGAVGAGLLPALASRSGALYAQVFIEQWMDNARLYVTSLGGKADWFKQERDDFDRVRAWVFQEMCALWRAQCPCQAVRSRKDLAQALVDGAMQLFYGFAYAFLCLEGVSPFHGFLSTHCAFAGLAFDCVQLFVVPLLEWLSHELADSEDLPFRVFVQTEGGWQWQEDGMTLLANRLQEAFADTTALSPLHIGAFCQQLAHIAAWVRGEKPLMLAGWKEWCVLC